MRVCVCVRVLACANPASVHNVYLSIGCAVGAGARTRGGGEVIVARLLRAPAAVMEKSVRAGVRAWQRSGRRGSLASIHSKKMQLDFIWGMHAMLAGLC